MHFTQPTKQYSHFDYGLGRQTTNTNTDVGYKGVVGKAWGDAIFDIKQTSTQDALQVIDLAKLPTSSIIDAIKSTVKAHITTFKDEWS